MPLNEVVKKYCPGWDGKRTIMLYLSKYPIGKSPPGNGQSDAKATYTYRVLTRGDWANHFLGWKYADDDTQKNVLEPKIIVAEDRVRLMVGMEIRQHGETVILERIVDLNGNTTRDVVGGYAWRQPGSKEREAYITEGFPKLLSDEVITLTDDLFLSLTPDPRQDPKGFIERTMRATTAKRRKRAGLRTRGAERVIDDTADFSKFAKEFTILRDEKRYGDDQDKTLWEIICYRYDNEDPKWRQRAELDQDGIPAAVLDLVPQRRLFELKPSHLALYHAADRVGIHFKIIVHDSNGKSFIKPSKSTLLRRYKDGLSQTTEPESKSKAQSQ